MNDKSAKDSHRRPGAPRRWLVRALIGLRLLLIALALGIWTSVRASLPQLDGDAAIPGLSAPVSLGLTGHGVSVVPA